MAYVVRSMTTTDYDFRSAQPVTPYHIYLMPRESRGRAYWSSFYNAARFDSPQAAEAEAVRLNLTNWDITPADHRTFPDFWELREMAPKMVRRPLGFYIA